MCENANRPAGSSNGCESGGWSVLRRDGRRRWTRTERVSIDPSRTVAASSRKAVGRAVGLEAAAGQQPGHAPAEPGDPIALEPLGKRPQGVEPEGLRGPGDELLTHRADHRRVAGRVDG